MGRILDLARQQLSRHTKDENSWSIPISFTSANGLQTASVVGVSSKQSMYMDITNYQFQNKNAHIRIVTKDIVDANPMFPIRNIYGEIDMNGCIANCKDSSDNTIKYKVVQTLPNETLGVIILLLNYCE